MDQLFLIKFFCFFELLPTQCVDLAGEYFGAFTNQDIEVFATYVIEHFELLDRRILLRQGNLTAAYRAGKSSLAATNEFLIYEKSLLSDRSLVADFLSLISGNRIWSECRLTQPSIRPVNIGRTLR